MILKFCAVIVIGYLLGSIPFGIIIGKRLIGKDVRQYGSGKMGATNVLRVAGRRAAALVAMLDVSKGVLSVLLAAFIIGNKGHYLVLGHIELSQLAAQALAALAAMAGHNWPIFLKFKGGRGVATFFGGLVALCPPAAMFGGAVLLAGAGLTKYASLGSIAGVIGSYAILIPLTVLEGFPVEYLIYALIGVVVITVMHKDNISRLLAGRERRIGEKA